MDDLDAIKALEDARDVLDWLAENYPNTVPVPPIGLEEILNASVFLESFLTAIGQEGINARGEVWVKQNDGNN
jgi:hypothetical protein